MQKNLTESLNKKIPTHMGGLSLALKVRDEDTHTRKSILKFFEGREEQVRNSARRLYEVMAESKIYVKGGTFTITPWDDLDQETRDHYETCVCLCVSEHLLEGEDLNFNWSPLEDPFSSFMTSLEPHMGYRKQTLKTKPVSGSDRWGQYISWDVQGGLFKVYAITPGDTPQYLFVYEHVPSRLYQERPSLVPEGDPYAIFPQELLRKKEEV